MLMLRRFGVPQQLALLGLASITLYPFCFMVITSLKTNDQFYSQFWTPALPLHVENYARVAPTVLVFIGNSLRYSIPTLLCVAVIATLAGYGFARFRFWGREPLFLAMLALMMLPAVLTLVPLFIQLRNWGWLNQPQAVILPWASLQVVFATYVMRVFFERLPGEMFEAARLDGLNESGLFIRMALPLSLPGLGTIAILDLLFTWNDVIWPLVALLDRGAYPVASGMIAFQGDYRTDFGPLFAGYTLACVPLIVFFVVMIRRFIRGLEAGLGA
jgi:ABC-type glycerol-3-phosphate transport system permease component